MRPMRILMQSTCGKLGRSETADLRKKKTAVQKRNSRFTLF